MSATDHVAVTGATGFIGKALVRELVRAGCRPFLLTRSAPGYEDLVVLREKLPFKQIDLTDSDSIRRGLEKIKPATIIHLAGTRGRRDVRGAGVACSELNLDATTRLLEAAMVTGVRRIVIVGSAEEYGNQAGPLNEALPLQPASPYGVSKAMATRNALAMHKRDGCPVVVVRPFSVYGPGQPPDMFVAEAIDSALREAPFKMSSGEQTRDLIFVEDVIRGLIAAACAPGIEGRVINLGTGRPHRLRYVAKCIWSIADTQAPLLLGARPTPEEELYDTWADITLAGKLLAWAPKVDLKDGLKRTIDWSREELREKALCRAM